MKELIKKYFEKLKACIKANNIFTFAAIVTLGAIFCGPLTTLFKTFAIESIVFISIIYSYLCYLDRNK